ncbi:MAG: alanine--tRNA ligase [Oscillospiraceae bacterium]|nr:alanine--tRNA ligase [Oscillospiraceae bacterium]
MQNIGLNELREKFLTFFESKNHTRLPSAGLIPQGDNSLLLINSGMAPLKKFFTGQETPPNVRVTTCQKCIRTPDIEQVGKTARHGTYFEMLGNFSFGEYFKGEATAWAWEFFTEVLEMPKELLYVSVYEEDDESYDIWTKNRGVDPSHMSRLGKADNFWEHGSGPCGPCSEIYFDRGAQNGCGSPDCKVGCECDRFVEVWNLVFTQFDSDGHGNYTPLAKKNIDTGMGLERLACVMQSVGNLFEVDTVQNIMNQISETAGVAYKKDEKTDVSLRVITDHIRSSTFMVCDGVTGSNVGRGYVLRRLLRRAARHGRLLGIEKPFLFEAADTVIKENEAAYPELNEKRDYIKKLIKNEEEAFSKTIDRGLEILSQRLAQITTAGEKILSGEDAFLLSDTYGFPIDLTVEIAAEKGVAVDLEQYKECLSEQKSRAKEDYKNKSGSSWEDDGGAMGVIDLPATEFTGYTSFEEQAKILAVFVGGEQADKIQAGENGTVILDKTPFYAESGGQVGDIGGLVSSDMGGIFDVTDTKKDSAGHILHMVTAIRGELSVGDRVAAVLSELNRKSIMRNHTAAHLLQSVLREVLGEHVHQAGQLVDSQRVRFDFSHFEAVTPGQLREVEDYVNHAILNALPVTSEEMPLEEAKKIGAMALFGEKYGDTVRVVKSGDSIELCGGTHVDNTSKLGLFKILSENSVAAGIRRIEGVTGWGVLSMINNYSDIIVNSANAVKSANPMDLAARCAAVVAEVKSLEKEVAELNGKLAGSQLDDLFKNAVQVGEVRVIQACLGEVKPEVLRAMGDKIKDKAADVVAVLASNSSMLCVCGKEAVSKGAHAGKIVQKVSALTGGKGGGRPDNAMAGIGDIAKIEAALSEVERIISELVGS